MEELLELSRRRLIYEHIVHHPGAYLREMQGALGLSVGDLQYHLGQLEVGHLINSKMEGKRKRFFATGKVAIADREVVSLMRLRTPRRIVFFLYRNPDASFRQILSEFSFTKGALSFHLKKLLKADVIEKKRRERDIIFCIKDVHRISRILVTYRSSIMDGAVDSFVDVWSKIG